MCFHYLQSQDFKQNNVYCRTINANRSGRRCQLAGEIISANYPFLKFAINTFVLYNFLFPLHCSGPYLMVCLLERIQIEKLQSTQQYFSYTFFVSRSHPCTKLAFRQSAANPNSYKNHNYSRFSSFRHSFYDKIYASFFGRIVCVSVCISFRI